MRPKGMTWVEIDQGNDMCHGLQRRDAHGPCPVHLDPIVAKLLWGTFGVRRWLEKSRPRRRERQGRAASVRSRQGGGTDQLAHQWGLYDEKTHFQDGNELGSTCLFYRLRGAASMYVTVASPLMISALNRTLSPRFNLSSIRLSVTLNAIVIGQVMDVGLQQLRPLKAGDIAVLCRTNDQVGLAVAALARWGIPTSSGRSGLLSTPEALLVLACLRRMHDASDTAATALILALADGMPATSGSPTGSTTLPPRSRRTSGRPRGTIRIRWSRASKRFALTCCR